MIHQAWALIVAESIKFWRETRRYLFDLFWGNVSLFLIFLAMFFGLKSFGGPHMSMDSLDAMIVGYITWLIAFGGFQTLGWFVGEENQRGTLEQLYLSPLGIEWSLLLRTALNFSLTFFLDIFILFLTMLVTNRWLPLNIPTIFLLLLTSVPGMWGLGLAFSSLMILYKKISSLFMVVTFTFVFLISLPAWPFTWYSLLPFSACAASLQALVRRGESFPWWWYLFLSGLSAAYLILGIVVFRIASRAAKRRNLLGQY